MALVGTTLAYFAAYITARMGGRFAKLLHLVCITTLAIPGLVLGLSYVLFFKGSVLYGTLAILVLVNLVHFFASPYLMAYNSLGKANENLEAVGSTMGIGRASILKDVLIPQTMDTIIEMAGYFFVNCMVTISAVAFLATTLDMPLALLITDLDAQRLTECAAFVSLIILLTNIASKLDARRLKKLFTRGSARGLRGLTRPSLEREGYCCHGTFSWCEGFQDTDRARGARRRGAHAARDRHGRPICRWAR